LTSKHRTRNIAFMIFGIVIVGAFSVLILLPDAGGTTTTFTIPSLSFIQTPEGAEPIGEINCKIRQVTDVISNTGSLIQKLESGVVEGSPFVGLQFTFDPQTQADISHFVVQPKAFCTQSNNIPIEVSFPRSINIQVKLQSCLLDSPEGQRGETACTGDNTLFGVGLQTPPLLFGSGEPEQDFANFIVTTNSIESRFADDLSAKVSFIVFGDMKIRYAVFPDTEEFNFPIGFNQLKTTYDITILREFAPINDLDDDGVVDEFDQCPTEKENYNGFEDTDGCPDVLPSGSPPTAEVTTTTISEEPLTCSDTTLFRSFLCNTCPIEYNPELHLFERQICIAQCEALGGTWTSTIGRASSSFGTVWHNGGCSGQSLIDEIIEGFTEPTVEVVTVEQLIEEITETSSLSEQGIVITTIQSVTEEPVISVAPAFEVQPPTIQPPPPERETIEIRPPMEEETFTLIIIILIILGLAGIVIASRFRKIKI